MLLVVGHEDALDLDLDAVHHRRSGTRAKKATGFFTEFFFVSTIQWVKTVRSVWIKKKELSIENG